MDFGEGTVRCWVGMGLGADRDWKTRDRYVRAGCVQAGGWRSSDGCQGCTGEMPVGPLFGQGWSTHSAAHPLLHGLLSQDPQMER